MIISFILLSILCFIYFNIYLPLTDNGIPLYPGKWPIIGHLHLIFKIDHIECLEFLRSVTSYSLKSNGCCKVIFGPCIEYIVLTDPEDCSKVLCKSPDKHYLYSFGHDWLGNGLLTGNVHKWKVHRKLMNPMFNYQNLNSFMPIFNKQAGRLVERFSKEVGRTFDHEPVVTMSNVETVFQIAFGLDQIGESSKNIKYANASTNLIHIMVKRFVLFWFHYKPFYDMCFLKKEFDENVNTIAEYTMELLEKRKSKLNSESNEENQTRLFVDTLLQMKKENIFTEQDFQDELNSLIYTSYDTIATAMTSYLMVLGDCKDFQEKIYKEIKELFGDSDRDVIKTDLDRLVYLDAFLKESLRVYPVISLIGRTVTADIKLKKYNLKAGDQCLVMIEGVHNHPDWGSDAEQFRPERWLNPDTIPKNSNMYIPFSAGKRNCIGKTYALMSMKTTLIHILRKFKVSSDLSKVVYKMAVLTKTASGQNLRLETRK